MSEPMNAEQPAAEPPKAPVADAPGSPKVSPLDRPPQPGVRRPSSASRTFAQNKPKNEKPLNPGGKPQTLDKRDFVGGKPNARELDKLIEEMNQAMAGFNVESTVEKETRRTGPTPPQTGRKKGKVMSDPRPGRVHRRARRPQPGRAADACSSPTDRPPSATERRVRHRRLRRRQRPARPDPRRAARSSTPTGPPSPTACSSRPASPAPTRKGGPHGRRQRHPRLHADQPDRPLPRRERRAVRQPTALSAGHRGQPRGT